jgi:hypothetical protein
MPREESHILRNLQRKKSRWPWGFISVVAVLWLVAVATVFKLVAYDCIYYC